MDESWVEFDYDEFSKMTIKNMAEGIAKILPDSVRPRQKTGSDRELGRINFFVFFDHLGTERSVYVSIKKVGVKSYITSAIKRSYGPPPEGDSRTRCIIDMLPEKDGPIGIAELGKFLSAYILEHT